MYGGSSGLLQVSKTGSECHEKSGFCKLYIGNKEVPDNAVLYFFLTAKSIVMIAFIISVFCDLFFVVSFGDCDEKHDCYFVDTNYYNPPIENCSEVLDNQTVCYAFNLGFVEAAGAAGGLIAFSRLLFTLWSGVSMCVASSLVGHSKTLLFTLALQIFLGISVFCTGIVLTWHFSESYLYKTESITQLRQFGNWLLAITLIISICLSIVTPWWLVIVKEVPPCSIQE